MDEEEKKREQERFDEEQKKLDEELKREQELQHKAVEEYLKDKTDDKFKGIDI